METHSLRGGHETVSGPEEDERDFRRSLSPTLESYYRKHRELEGIPAEVIRRAWFTMSHMLLRPGSKVADMGTNPMMTFVMAALNPHIHFTGIDTNKKLIRQAQKNYMLRNLEFRAGDISSHAGFEEGSLDAVINSFILHEVYSSHKCLEKYVIRTLENHFAILKREGVMFIRDFAMPPPEQYVLMEMPDIESKSEAIEDLSEADLLVRYSHHARPQGGNVYMGFFLEELPPRFPQTRLFRLPYKWAYEFIMRKDNRKNWQQELSHEYAFFTQREYRKNLSSLGARVLYTAPEWDERVIKERFEGRFRLYSDDGKLIGSPSTSFIAVAQKMGDRKSLNLHEMRPSHSMESNIRITAMRNDSTGDLFDVISRDTDVTELIPYRIDEYGGLNIFVHEGSPRGIANAVPRTGKELDGKRWSGHMVEAISVPTEAVIEAEQGEPKATILFARDYLGLKPAMGSDLEKGGSHYPAPDLIDEQIKTRFLRVTEHEGAIEPKVITPDLEGFTTRGVVREVSAQSVLNAISVGYIPSARLETQILELYDKLEMEPETWDECPLVLDVGTPEKMLDFKKFTSLAAGSDKRFRAVKGTAGQVRTIKSIFVDEGWVEGGLQGLASRDIEFIISDDQTVNKAVILPLTKCAKTGEVMAGLVREYLPVPQRHQGNGLSLRAPSVTLPKDVTTIDQAKKFIADQFELGPEKVARLGESYFCHLGVTPVRIFPFCINTAGTGRGPLGGPVEFAPMKFIFDLIDILDVYNHARTVVYRYRKTYINLGYQSGVTGDWVRSADQVYAATMDAKPAVVNSSHTAGILPTGGGRSKSVAAAPYATSPDFLDIRDENRVRTETTFTAQIPGAEPKQEEAYAPRKKHADDKGGPEQKQKQSGN